MSSSTMDILDWIDVGQVAAEADPNLHHYFYDDGVSASLINNPLQFLLLGRKGAGKTALFRHIERRPDDLFGPTDLLVPLSLVNYNWKAHELLANPMKAPTLSQRDSWRFVICVEAYRALAIDAEAKKEELPSELAARVKVLERLFATPVPSWTRLLGEKLFGLSKFKLPNASLDEFEGSLGEASFEELQGSAKLRAELSRNIDAITNYLEQGLRDLSSKRVFLVFDRLDEAWDPSSYEICKQIIVGLVHASSHVTTSFAGAVRPIVFLREDVFSVLDLNDKNKLREDSGAILKWDNDALEKMALVRISYYARTCGAEPPKTLDSLFDREKMRQGTKPSRYILKRTLSRPRDVIAYLKKVIEAAKEARSEGTDQREDLSKLSSDSIYFAESAYSEWLVLETKDEWKTQMPQIETMLAVLENLEFSSFDQDAFERQYKRKVAEAERSDTRSALRFLFDNSLVGVKVGNQWRFKCVNASQRFEDAEQFQTHPGLKRHLGLKDVTGGAAAGADE